MSLGQCSGRALPLIDALAPSLALITEFLAPFTLSFTAESLQ